MRKTIILLTVFIFPALGYSATHYVPDDFSYIQEAINAAMNGDIIIVKPGTYVELIDLKGKAITLKSEQGSAVTTIDGNQAGRVVTCQNNEGPDSVLEGFTIANGYISGIGSGWVGGGMLNSDSSPTVIDCIFFENYAEHSGGGMYNDNGNPTVMNCTFLENTTDANGGGMGNSDNSPTVTNCTFSGNSAYYGGGGMSNSSSSPTVTNCTFSENSAEDGGGMSNFYSNPTVTNCTFLDNSASAYYYGHGGGMYNLSSSPTVTNCNFSENMVSGLNYGHSFGYGGGMCNEGGSPTVTNCTFYGNFASAYYDDGYGGGMCNNGGSPTVTNCTFYGNYAQGCGGGMCSFGSSPTTVTNTILWNNDAPEGPEIWLGLQYSPSTVTINYSDVKGGQSSVYIDPGCTLNWGSVMIDADPLFADPAKDDFHLTWLSPCINRGTNDGAPLEDFEGDPRPYMGTVDMGADEFVGTHPLAADVFSFSAVTGGTVNFTLTGGLDNHDCKYIVLGGVSGTAPGIALPGGMATLPVNWDAFTNIVLALLNTSVFSNFLGTLDGSGTATAQLNVPPVPDFAGVTMHYAYAMNNPWDFVSNPVAVEIVQ